MNHLIKLCLQEFVIQNRVYNLGKYIFIFFMFCIVSIALVNDHENIQNFGIIMSVICIPLAFIGVANNIIKPDINNGNLEMLLTIFPASKIAIAKYLALFLCSSSSFMLSLPLIYLIFNIKTELLLIVFISSILLMLLSGSLIILIAAIQGYFYSNTNFISILIMPLIIPGIILSGMVIQNPANISLLMIILGINLIIIPVALLLSSYLIANIYNI